MLARVRRLTTATGDAIAIAVSIGTVLAVCLALGWVASRAIAAVVGEATLKRNAPIIAVSVLVWLVLQALQRHQSAQRQQ